MRILFVIKDIEYIDPMGLMLLSALARERGHTTGISVLTGGDLRADVVSFRPDIVAFSAKTGEHKYYTAASRAIKGISKDILTVMGGPHTTFFPETIENEDIDYLCVGEGDDAWPELLDAIEGNGSADSIPNIVTRANYTPGEPVLIRPKRAELDTLPFLDRELFYRGTRLGRFPMRSFMVGRGCPFKCTYCFNHKYNTLYRGKGPVVTRMSVDRVLRELEALKDSCDTQFIKFYDDIFALKNDAWLEEFADEYPRRVGVPFHCLTRADLLTEPMLLNLKRAGLASISMSIESGNARVRDEILKRNMTEEQMITAFELCSSHSIPTFSNTIFAIPGTTIKEDIESLDMNLRCKVTLGEFPIFYPYPGTELACYAIDRGYFDGDFDRLHMSYQNVSPLTCFSDKEKLEQVNLSLLATVCLLIPRLRDVTIKHLIKLPLTKLYFLIYFLVKATIVKKKIYPMRFSPINFIRGVYESFVLEYFKHSGETLEKTAGEGGKN